MISSKAAVSEIHWRSGGAEDANTLRISVTMSRVPDYTQIGHHPNTRQGYYCYVSLPYHAWYPAISFGRFGTYSFSSAAPHRLTVYKHKHIKSACFLSVGGEKYRIWFVWGSFNTCFSQIRLQCKSKLCTCENVRLRNVSHALTCQVELQFCKMLFSLCVCLCLCSSTDDHQQDGAAPNTATHTQHYVRGGCNL